jgi:hypothetical protein
VLTEAEEGEGGKVPEIELYTLLVSVSSYKECNGGMFG